MEERATTDNGDLAPLQRPIGIFTMPRATFSSLVGSISTVDILIPVFVVLVISLAMQPLVEPIAMEEQTQTILQRDDLPDDEKEIILDRMERFGDRMGGPLGYLIIVSATLVWYAVLAGVIMFFGSFILGGQASFKDTLGVVVYAQLVNVVELMVKIPLIIQTQTIQVETSLALLLPGSLDSTLLYRFFHRLDFFSIWRIFLLALGLAICYGVVGTRWRSMPCGAWAFAILLLAWLFDGRGIA